MSMRNKLLMLVGIALSGLVLLSSLSLYELRQSLLADRMEKTRNLVEMAVSVTGYYEREAQEGRLETADAQRLAKNALTRLRYDGDEYFFVLDQELTYVAHGFKQALVGKSAFGVSTPDGEDVGQLLRGALQGNGEFHYRWDKPGSSAPVQKLSFVASSPAWHWVIGTGIYVDDVDSAFWGGKPKPPKIPSTQFQPRHDRIQIDNLTIAVKGIVPVQVNMAPRCRRNLLEQGEGFLVPAGFTLGQQPRKDRRVVVDDGVGDPPRALVTDFDFDVGLAGQFLLAADLSDG